MGLNAAFVSAFLALFFVRFCLTVTTTLFGTAYINDGKKTVLITADPSIGKFTVVKDITKVTSGPTGLQVNWEKKVAYLVPAFGSSFGIVAKLDLTSGNIIGSIQTHNSLFSRLEGDVQSEHFYAVGGDAITGYLSVYDINFGNPSWTNRTKVPRTEKPFPTAYGAKTNTLFVSCYSAGYHASQLTVIDTKTWKSSIKRFPNSMYVLEMAFDPSSNTLLVVNGTNYRRNDWFFDVVRMSYSDMKVTETIASFHTMNVTSVARGTYDARGGKLYLTIGPNQFWATIDVKKKEVLMETKLNFIPLDFIVKP
jgi:hypothetical protein